MKVEVSSTKDQASPEFNGLVVDREGDVWLVMNDHAILICPDDSEVSMTRDRLWDQYGPIRPYTGTVTMSNE